MVDERETLLNTSGNNISNLIALMTMHEENISRYSRGLDIDIQLLSLLTPHITGATLQNTINTTSTILQNVNQCIYQNIESPLNQTCPITHENFQPADEVILLNNCQHIFKRTAIIRWLQRNNTCPACRTRAL